MCGGYEEAPRGQGKRCEGWTSADGYVHCARAELAGDIDQGPDGLFAHRPHGNCKCGVEHAPAKEPPGVEAVYSYQAENGVELFQVVRKVGKKFIQRHDDGFGGWIWKMEGVRRVPYRLPRLIEADPSRTVFIVEGEKDVEAAERIGLLATCNPGGAGKWGPVAETAATVLAGRDVVVIADADDVGRKHAAAVAAALAGAKRVRVVELPQKDLGDFLAAGGSRESLEAVLDGAPPAPAVEAKPPREKKPKPARAERTGVLAKLLTRDGITRANAANVATILVNDPRWAGVLAYDEFAESIVTCSAPPWRPDDIPAGGVILGDWSAPDTARFKTWLSQEFDIDVPTGEALDGVLIAAHRRRIHPVCDWLKSLRWDGKKRLPTWLIDVMGCEDTPYARAVGQAWAVSAVARAFKPGCKVDTVLVLEGKPGTFKSSVLRALFGDAWFLEMSITDVSNKDAMQVLRRKWGAEFPEIDGLSKHEQASVKSYFSRQVDTYRKSYGHTSGDFPRQAVFAATTNKNDWITDETGGTGRRMWPIRCTRGDVALATELREQLWAEARARYESGEAWHITDPELLEASRLEQDARFRVDPWEETIAKWLASPSDIGSRMQGVSTAQVLAGALLIDHGKRDPAASMRVGAILRRLDWVPGQQQLRDGARVRLYRPVEGAVEAEEVVEPDPRVQDLFDDRERAERESIRPGDYDHTAEEE